MAKLSAEEQLEELIHALNDVEDPRIFARSKHLLVDILVLTVLGILCGAEGVTEIEEFGHQKIDFLGKYLTLPNGIPSHDTIARVLSLIDPESFEKAFAVWVARSLDVTKPGDWVSIDGKSVNGTERNSMRGARPLHLVSAFSHRSGLSLCQAQSKSSGMAEKDAALECLKMLDLSGLTITMDAGLNAKEIVNYIVSNKGHYVTPVKRNHRSAVAQLDDLFSIHQGETAMIEEKGHARVDVRHCEVLPADKLFPTFHDSFPKSATVAKITRTRIDRDKRKVIWHKTEDGMRYHEKNEANEKEETTTVYYVSSIKLTAIEAIERTKQHWTIENKLHWVLDVAFREDECAVRAKRAARSLALARKIAFNLIKSSNTKGSVRARMKRAAWNNNFLESLITGKF